MIEEIYIPIKGLEDKYHISNIGNVKSLKTNKVLKQSINNMGWRNIALEGKCYMTHKLVALHFIPNPNNYSGCAVKKSKTDCTVGNIKWVENAQDRKLPRYELIEYYEGVDQSKWYPMQRMIYKFLLDGNSKHIEFIFTRSYKKWYGHLLKLTRNEEQAQDILQNCYEFFIDTINEGRFRIDKCFVDYSPDVWIIRIVRNQGCTWLKQRGKTVSVGSFFNESNYDDYE